MEHKHFPALGIKILDEDLGIVEHVITVFGIVDYGKDVSHLGSFTKTIQERGTKVLVLDQHRTDSALAVVGKPLELREIGRHELPIDVQQQYPTATGGVLAKTQFLMDTPEGRGMFIRIKEDALREWSYGYDALDTDMSTVKQDGKDVQVRNLRTVKLYEYSPVLWGMNPATSVISAKDKDGEKPPETGDETEVKNPVEEKPYNVFKVDGEYCVYKVDPDGKRTGDSLGCHASRDAAVSQIQAINIHEHESDSVDPAESIKSPDEDGQDDTSADESPTIITVTIELPKGREREVLEALKNVSVVHLIHASGAPDDGQTDNRALSQDDHTPEPDDKSKPRQAANEAGPDVEPPTSDLLQRLEIEQAELDLILEGAL